MPRVSPWRSVFALLGVIAGVGILFRLVSLRRKKLSRNAATNAVAKRRAGLCAAILAGDADRAAQFYADRSQAITKNGTVLKGRDAIAERMASDSKTGRFTRAEAFESVRVGDGHLVVELGSFCYSFSGANGATRDVDGGYLAVWRNSGGQWQIALETANLEEGSVLP